MNTRVSVSTKRLVPLSLAMLAASVLLVPGAANATPYVVTLAEEGGHVVAHGSGSIDLADLFYYIPFVSDSPAMDPSYGHLNTGPSGHFDTYTGFTGPANFGSGGAVDATVGSGDSVEIFGNIEYYGAELLWVPRGYVSGTTLSSHATWESATFASLGVDPGTYVWTWGNGAEQRFTLQIGPSAVVAEPLALGMFGLGALLVGGFVTLRRREQQQS